MRHPRRSLVMPLTLLGLGLCDCTTTRPEYRTQPIQVVTDPPRAWVWVKDESGRRIVGQSPVAVEQRYSVTKKALSPWWWGVVGLSATVTGVGAALYDQNSDMGNVLTYAGGAALALSLVGYYYLDQWLSGEVPAEPRPVTLGASLDGYLDQQATLMVPGEERQTRLLLPRDPSRPVAEKAIDEEPELDQVAWRTSLAAVAVFDIEDSSRSFALQTLNQLTDYLVARLTQVACYRVVPRDQLRARLGREKQGSHRKCFDQACQIELGKSLAAQKSLATKILRVGSRCVITSTLYDLKTETSERSALARTDCEEEALMDALDRVARQFSRSDFR